MKTGHYELHGVNGCYAVAKTYEQMRKIVRHIESYMDPKGGQRIDFPAGCGPAVDNWMEAAHD